MIGSPSQRFGWPNTNRTAPVIGLMPTVPSRTPSEPAASPFTIAPALSAETIAMPKNATAAISGKAEGENDRLGNRYQKPPRTTAPTSPPNAETA